MARHSDSGKERRWLQIVQRWRKSRLGVREFCQWRGVSEPRFYVWRRTLRERGLINEDASTAVAAAAAPAFVQVAEAGSFVPSGIELVLGAGRLLRIRPGFDTDLLRQLLRVLEEPSC
jgi:hypothetical protein